MNRILVALLAGTIFGFGLCTSEMINPARVIGFLDIAGAWDATLIFVIVGAIAVTGIGFLLVLRRESPILADQFLIPDKTIIDIRLLGGSALFGAGWGLAGLCPGPAIAGLASLSPSLMLFVVMMIVGNQVAARLLSRGS